jgi:hypothetical protein
MSEVVVKIPDYLRKQAESVAARENISLDELVALALASHVSAWHAKGYLEERAKRGSWEKFKAVLDRAPDVEPPEWDKLPAGYQPAK